jgi:hypothetical protein
LIDDAVHHIAEDDLISGLVQESGRELAMGGMIMVGELTLQRILFLYRVSNILKVMIWILNRDGGSLSLSTQWRLTNVTSSEMNSFRHDGGIEETWGRTDTAGC